MTFCEILQQYHSKDLISADSSWYWGVNHSIQIATFGSIYLNLRRNTSRIKIIGLNIIDTVCLYHLVNRYWWMFATHIDFQRTMKQIQEESFSSQPSSGQCSGIGTKWIHFRRWDPWYPIVEIWILHPTFICNEHETIKFVIGQENARGGVYMQGFKRSYGYKSTKVFGLS